MSRYYAVDLYNETGENYHNAIVTLDELVELVWPFSQKISIIFSHEVSLEEANGMTYSERGLAHLENINANS